MSVYGPHVTFEELTRLRRERERLKNEAERRQEAANLVVQIDSYKRDLEEADK